MKQKDIRYKRTREAIFLAMISLLKRHDFDHISVKMICEEASVSRSGFYLHFVDKYALVDSYMTDFLNYANTLVQQTPIRSKQRFLLHMLTHLKNEGQLIALLLSKNGSIEIQTRMKQLIQQNAKQNILPYLDLTITTPTEERFALAFLSNAIFGILQEWINSGQVESPETIVQLLNKLIAIDFR
ncbi:TetR/AcrR family transcriptional regulator [Enterococcus italicus]|uniref:TetR/AcrR family transcriptional regulator n=1 Tax=Enterococcus italicus TaxID=246144 RepID=UPI0028A99950|nr:TetR/AcrR family transcriptional regulator [Enterococcus italicus]